jgi:RNA polymerase sigma-70 factor, ECF subfamily
MDVDRPNRDNSSRDEEFVRLFGLNQGRVFAYIVTPLPCWADAEDVLQRTSLILWQKFDQFQPSADFARWACGVAHRQTLKYLNQQGRRRQVLSEAVLEKVAQTRIARDDLLKDRCFAIDDCVAQLPASDREIIEHYYYEDNKTAADVGRELGRPTNTILKALIRIRKSLQRCVERAVSSEKQK